MSEKVAKEHKEASSLLLRSKLLAFTFVGKRRLQR
nr:MAG TPA: hypothetical protein [Caudoviricetes sp.]